MSDPTPSELLAAAAERLDGRINAVVTFPDRTDITEPLVALLETLAVQARLFPGAEIGERVARAILGEGENRG